MIYLLSNFLKEMSILADLAFTTSIHSTPYRNFKSINPLKHLSSHQCCLKTTKPMETSQFVFDLSTAPFAVTSSPQHPILKDSLPVTAPSLLSSSATNSICLLPHGYSFSFDHELNDSIPGPLLITYIFSGQLLLMTPLI